MTHKIITAVFLIIALVLAILATTLPRENLADLILVTNFFDVMIPVLAVGALVKYLLCCPKNDK